jgi:flagellar basal body-associated protein FliL
MFQPRQGGQRVPVSLLWIIIIVILVLALLGYFGRGRF